MSRKSTTAEEFAYLDELAERMRTARREAGYTQLDLAHAIGITLSTMSRYEGGAHGPTAYVLHKWAVLTGVTADYLLFGNDMGDQDQQAVPE